MDRTTKLLITGMVIQVINTIVICYNYISMLETVANACIGISILFVVIMWIWFGIATR